MQGKVLQFSDADARGVISGEDGIRYSFAGADWRLGGLPIEGTQVDFVTEGTVAKDIFADQPGRLDQTSRPTAPQPSPGLCRSSDQGWIGGVCAGLAHTAGTRPVIFRVLIVVVTRFLWIITIPMYIVAWILLPARPTIAK
jgi:phage shock protein PspC (stress-responsive transcriptional regulator)